jgi:hypothetical protein
MKAKLRTTALAVSLIAAATPSLSSSAEAAPWGWHGGWHGGGHGGWGGFGLGLAAAALIGGALAAPYYDYPYGYAPGYYGYPSYSYGYSPALYGYRHYGYRYARHRHGGYRVAHYRHRR